MFNPIHTSWKNLKKDLSSNKSTEGFNEGLRLLIEQPSKEWREIAALKGLHARGQCSVATKASQRAREVIAPN